MASGGAVCSVAILPETRVAEIKTHVEEQTGVPVSEQRLFIDGQELAGDTAVSQAVAAAPGHGLELVRTKTDPLVTDLSHFRPDEGAFPALPSGEFALVGKIASGLNGDIFSYQWSRAAASGGADAAAATATTATAVAVKRLRAETLAGASSGTETDERKVHLRLSQRKAPSGEDALTEIGVLTYLSQREDRPAYLLRALAVFRAPGAAWLVAELAAGGELLDEVSRRGGLAEAAAKEYCSQLLQAVAYLDAHNIGHRDISLENVLLSGGEVRLIDFGMAVQSRSPAGTLLRYFRAVGKAFYRAPECYVPQTPTVEIVAPDDAAPGGLILAEVSDRFLCELRLPADAAPGRACRADVWGYGAPAADVFAAGVCLFTMLACSPPWEKACLADGRFAFVRRHGLARLLEEWNLPQPSAPAMQLLAGMTHPDPSLRPSAAACLLSAWLAA